MKTVKPIRAIEQLVCSYFSITSDELLSKSRLRKVVEKRQIFHYTAKLYTKNSLAKIGNYRGYGYGHATVLNSIKTIKNLIETDKHWKSEIESFLVEVEKIPSIVNQKKLELEEDISTIKKSVDHCSTRKELNKILHNNIQL